MATQLVDGMEWCGEGVGWVGLGWGAVASGNVITLFPSVQGKKKREIDNIQFVGCTSMVCP